MFKKILIANRSEIALRIIRACEELGIQTVAIYSQEDRFALHVKRSEEAYCLSNHALEAYLDGARIIACAKKSGCEAIHPGYGFLSENATFAKDCEAAGLKFIGPSADVISKMGSKIEARRVMQAHGIPIVPGSDCSVDTLEDAIFWGEKLGYPVMLKATFGAGGRGIRLCKNKKQIEQFYPRVQSEAKTAFGRSQIFMEKYICEPKHIEVQILADSYGKILHLFERDCSIQRRHQKLIECAPAFFLNQALREQLHHFAVKAARAVNYVNAGTIEFVVDDKERPYFLEMNTRLQVEHPITEQLCGIDLVQAQIKIAAGEPFTLNQEDIKPRGMAIEFRINAEDPTQDFLPSFGRVTNFVPPQGPGVRMDSALYQGYTIPQEYDSMIAKLIVWSNDWESLRMRSIRALKELKVEGITTTIPFYLSLLQLDDFKKGPFTTAFIENHPEALQGNAGIQKNERASLIATLLLWLSRENV